MSETAKEKAAPLLTPLLTIDGLKTYFRGEYETTKAVDDITLEIGEGETLGLVGESGSGKSVTSLTIMQLLPNDVASIEGGKISMLGKDLLSLQTAEMRGIRGKTISMIFQEPGTSLNPVYRVGDQVAEAISLHEGASRKEARARTIELFKEVGIPDPERRVDSYPHEMSGGQKQRVMIAMAISCNPKLLIADEPTTALDVTIQAQILDLLRKLRDERGMGILFITHDLGVIAEIADRVAVMFRGKLVEENTVREIFANPAHPYTRGLLACRPRPSSSFRRLPTVADYMDVVTHDDGTVELNERENYQENIDKLVVRGRGRLFHPAKELKTLGYEIDPERDGEDASCVAADEKPLVEIKGLKVHYPIRTGLFRRVTDHVRAVDGVDFNIYRGQTLGLVGESGCGKTTIGRSILRLQPRTAGKVIFDGIDTGGLGRLDLRKIRSRMQIIFQDPYGSLNPRMTVAEALTEVMQIHGFGSSHKDRVAMAADLLERVGLPGDHLRRYPHEFSGGQRQRIGIARALAVKPEFIICDESVSALDVSVQAQVLNLLRDLQEEHGLTYLFISHDLSVVKFMSDMIAVMNDGKILEFGPADAIYNNPQDPYTERLIESIPKDTLESIDARLEARKKARTKRENA